ncbi:MAG: discoidin domain-containing protein [bacterium]
MRQDQLLDDFEDLSGWTPFASAPAELRISRDRGSRGRAMRLDFDFHGGGGFVVARKAFALAMPESYSFGFRMRASASVPRNHFELKLVDGSNQNVWRYRVEEMAFPAEWQSVRIRDSRIEFAWGPRGGGPAGDVAAIELVIAAGLGGSGTVWFEELCFRDETYRSTPRVTASSALAGHDPDHVLDPSGGSSWLSEPGEEAQWLLIDFQEERELGGLVIRWQDGFGARQFEVQVSADGAAWETLYATSQGGGGRSYVYLPQTVARCVRLQLRQSAEGRGFGIRAIEVKPHDFARSLNHFFQSIARDHPAGLYPKYFLGRQTYWTPVGTGHGDGQALINEEGMVEADKGSFSIAPFLYTDGRLVTWADAALGQELMRGYLPIPSVRWQAGSWILEVTAFAAGEPARSALFIRYRIENTGRERRPVALFAAILPFQVTPTWQSWRSFGGVSPVRELSFCEGAVRVNGNKRVVPLRPAAAFGAAAFAQGSVTEYLARGELPHWDQVTDELGFASGALRFDLDLGPFAAEEVVLAVPFGQAAAGAAALEDGRAVAGAADGSGPLCPSLLRSVSAAEALEEAVGRWESILDSVEIRLPQRAQAVADTFRTAAAHILINREGPELHPGPRRYSRSWIRDGAVMGAALLRLGLSDAIRDFIRWYKDYQAEDGKIPDCVDREGTEWLPEFDAYGQLVYSVMEHFRFTRDRSFLEEMRPAVARALAFMEGLRSLRLTPEYRQPEKQAGSGLLPESMSHEGYMAHPVHAYWDDFWALRGLQDAAAMAEVLGDRAEAGRLAAVRDGLRADLRASLAATMVRHGIEYVPGSVELGDFDPAATSVAIGLLDQLAVLPRPAVEMTFDKYLAGFRERAGGAASWANYSAYEIRIIGALVRLGRRRDALDLVEFMLADRRIPAWNQWPEISWRDPSGPSFIGDLPHTWISAEYILAIRSLFAYEREEDESLVIAAGVDPAWLEDGSVVGVSRLPTHHGSLSYRMSLGEGGDTLRLTLEGGLELPKGGIFVQPPLARPMRRVEVNGRPIAELATDGFTLRECPAEAVVRCVP